MSYHQSIHIGPYAVWIADPSTPYFDTDAWHDEERPVSDMTYGGPADSADRPLEHYVFPYLWTTADRAARSAPDRPMSFHDCLPTEMRLEAVDRQGEVEWFRRAYQDELGVLGRYYGSEPDFRWGVLCRGG